MTVAEPNMWGFWLSSLAGEKPETTPGCPHQGFYIVRQYFSVPFGHKRVLCDCPTAIWFDGKKWFSRIDDLKNQWTNDDVDTVDEVFARCCRDPITHERYLEMVKTIGEYRK